MRLYYALILLTATGKAAYTKSIPEHQRNQMESQEHLELPNQRHENLGGVMDQE